MDNLITQEQLQRLRAGITSDVDSGKVTVVNPTTAEAESAVQLLTKQYLTAVDALQIATAKMLGPGAVLVSSDAKLNRVAAEQGLTVMDPATTSSGSSTW